MLFSASFNAAIEDIMAHAANTAIMPRLGKLLAGDRQEKAVDEPVTTADRESEKILADGLHRLLPEAEIVGEEAADADPAILAQLGSQLCWVIDPLDGTGNFAAGSGPFGILIALASGGVPIGGWLYDPRSRRFCAASKGGGAMIDGEPVRARRSGKRKPIAAISTFLSNRPEGQRLVEVIGRNCATEPIPRCAAEQYPRMVLGRSDITLFGRTLPWDHAAGVLFLTEAGGVVTRFDGSPYCVADDRFGLIASVDEPMWQLAVEAAGLSCGGR